MLIMGRSIAISLLLIGLFAGPALADEYVIIVDDMQFGEAPAELQVGDVIIWKNNDIFQHTATAVDGSFDVDLPANSEARLTVSKSGQIDFYCRYHPTMTGSLVVSP